MQSIFNVIILIIMGVFWGLHFAVAKLASEAGNSDMLLFPTLVVILLMFYYFFRKNGRSITVIKKSAKFFALAALLGYLIPLCLELYVSSKISTSFLAVIVTSVPAFTIAINLLFQFDPVKNSHILSLILSVIGVCIIFIYSGHSMRFDFSDRLFLAFLIPFCYAIYNIFIKKCWPNKLTSIDVAFGETFAAVIFLSPFFVSSIPHVPHYVLSEASIFIGYILSTFIEVWMFFVLIERTNSIFVSFSTPIALVSGFFWGNVFFNEVITNMMIVGALVVLLSTICLEFNVSNYFKKVS